MLEFKFGPVFTRWVRLLYNVPKAEVSINNGLSDYFSLARGTRQGCPLSPLLFTLAIEPLAIAMSTAREKRGFYRGVDKEKKSCFMQMISFYSREIVCLLSTVINLARFLVYLLTGKDPTPVGPIRKDNT